MTFRKTTWLTAFLAIAAAVLVSCTKTDPVQEGHGYVAFYTATNPSVNCIATKADDADDEDVIAIKIIDSSSEQVWSCTDYYSEVTDPIDLPTGIYTAVATSGTRADAVFDEPFYSCTEKFTVYNQKITTLDLTLTLEAVKVTATFTDDFDEYFTRYDLSVDNGLDDGELTFSKDEGTLDSEGYFSVTGTLNYTLYLTNTDGTEYTISDTYTDVVARQYYAFSFSIEAKPDTPDGAGVITIRVDDSLNEKDHTYYIDLADPIPVTVSVKSVEAWAEFATVTGKWNGEEPEGTAFEWREAGGSSWQSVAATVDEDAGTFSAEIRGLSAETDYEVRAVATDVDASDAVTFTTEDEQTVPNLNFDTWYDVGKYWSPNVDGDHIYWDTANKGSSSLSVYPTSREEDHIAVDGDGKYAVKMESKEVNAYVYKTLAAGNIYTGKFNKISGIGADLYWGYEFSSRPVALKGWYDYSPAAIDYADDSHSDLEGTPDTGSIQIFLTDWDEQFEINTNNSVFVDYDADYIIARGILYLDETDGYTEFTLPLEYYDTSRTPTYIVISCAASALGDYFTGGTGSVLYVDEFSLVYDPDELD